MGMLPNGEPADRLDVAELFEGDFVSAAGAVSWFPRSRPLAIALNASPRRQRAVAQPAPPPTAADRD